MASSGQMTRDSISSPAVLMAKKVPPTMLELPGPVTTVVIPWRRAASKVASSGLMASKPRSPGRTGSVYSFPSISSRQAVPHRPAWQWGSTRPGVTVRPAASMIWQSSGTSPTWPTFTIFPSSIRISPVCSYIPAMVIKFPFLISSN